MISGSFILDTELNKCIGKVAITMSTLTKIVWNNSKLTEHTEILVYKACVVRTLFSDNGSGTEIGIEVQILPHALPTMYFEHLLM